MKVSYKCISLSMFLIWEALPLVERLCTAHNDLHNASRNVTYSVRGVRFFIFSQTLLVHYHVTQRLNRNIANTPHFNATQSLPFPFVFIAASFECCGYTKCVEIKSCAFWDGTTQTYIVIHSNLLQSNLLYSDKAINVLIPIHINLQLMRPVYSLLKHWFDLTSCDYINICMYLR